MKKLAGSLGLAGLMALIIGCQWDKEVRPDDSPWSYGRPAKAGFSEPTMLELDSIFRATTNYHVTSMLLVKDEQVIFENYYLNNHRDSLQAISSVGNVLVSMLVGVAISEGFFNSINDPIYGYLPAYSRYFERDTLKKSIRLKDVLTMRTGLSWNETLTDELSPTSDLRRIKKQVHDRVAYLLEKPLESLPGQRFSQNSAASLLLVKAVEEASGQSVTDLLSSRLFGPMSINQWEADADDTGLTDIATGIRLKPLDLAKIGYLMLQKGRWAGRQLIDEAWVAESTAVQYKISTFLDTGYLWRRFSDDSAWSSLLPQNDIFYAHSNDDQYLFVLPSLNMVYVLTTAWESPNTGVGFSVLSNFLLTLDKK